MKHLKYLFMGMFIWLAIPAALVGALLFILAIAGVFGPVFFWLAWTPVIIGALIGMYFTGRSEFEGQKKPREEAW